MNSKTSVSLAWVNDAMCRLEEEIRYASQTDAHVMMTGESGVGKRFVADLIHQSSHRRRGAFVVVHGTDVFENGPTRAGTDAMGTFHQGLLQTANNGTLLIQEIENIPAPAQAQLLRFIENTTTRGNNVRLMTATSVHLLERVHTGSFRDDLFYRLNTVHLVIPPLRERPEDIPVMFHHYLSLHSRTEAPRLSSAAQQRLVEYPWPGNVRELQTVTKKLSAQALPEVIEPEHLPCPIGG
jgi:DNA-binding NtrC family response regulator